MSPTYTYIKPKFLCNGEVKLPLKKIGLWGESINLCRRNRTRSIIQVQKYSYLISFILWSTILYSDCAINQFSWICIWRIYNELFWSNKFNTNNKDRIGREPTFILSWFIATSGILGIYLSTNIVMLIISTFIMGFGEIGSYILCFVMINEICGNKLR